MLSLEECLRAIQAKCLDCCGGSREEVAACGLYSCALHPYRLGDRQGSLLNEPAQAGQGEPAIPAALICHEWSRDKAPAMADRQASLLE